MYSEREWGHRAGHRGLQTPKTTLSGLTKKKKKSHKDFEQKNGNVTHICKGSLWRCVKNTSRVATSTKVMTTLRRHLGILNEAREMSMEREKCSGCESCLQDSELFGSHLNSL